MSSPAQLAANQANSKLSTGPVTDEGKAASSQNNLKYGLTCRTFHVRPCESQEDFARYANTLIDYYKPATIIEDTLVRKMAQHHLCSQRALLAQDRCFFEERGVSTCTDPELQRELALYLRYQGEHDRAFYKCRQEMDKIQAARKAEPAKQELAAVRLEITKLKREHGQFRNQKFRSAAFVAPASVAVPAPAAVSMPVAA
jgi:hypothetical protein